MSDISAVFIVADIFTFRFAISEFISVKHHSLTLTILATLFQEIITTLLLYHDDTSVGICTQLAYYYYFDKESSGEFPEQLVFEVLTAVPSNKNQNHMYGYYWNKIAQGFLKRHPNRSIELLTHIFKNMGRIFRYGHKDYIKKVADDIVIVNPLESWKIISGYLVSEAANRYEIIHWLGDTEFEDSPRICAINFIPPKEIVSWIKQDAEERM